jgi:outer membrane receptor protein involved in Fe transport
MITASYSLLFANQLHAGNDVPNAPAINAAIDSDSRLVNTPIHLGALRAIVPVVPNVVSAAFRITAEGPRRTVFNYMDEHGLPKGVDTPAFALADLVLSGNITRFGIRWAAGIYNLFGAQYYLPVSASYASISALQPGRTYIASLTATF